MTFPSSGLQKCPETLPKTDIDRDDWFKLDIEAQVEVITRHAQNFALGYFRCAIIHNVSVDAYTESLEARKQWILDNDEPKD